MIEQLNARLQAAKLGVKIRQRGNRLSLRATLPPRPGSGKSKLYQQCIPLAVYANPAGFKKAEAEAHRVGTLLEHRYRIGMSGYSRVISISGES